MSLSSASSGTLREPSSKRTSPVRLPGHLVQPRRPRRPPCSMRSASADFVPCTFRLGGVPAAGMSVGAAPSVDSSVSRVIDPSVASNGSTTARFPRSLHACNRGARVAFALTIGDELRQVEGGRVFALKVLDPLHVRFHPFVEKRRYRHPACQTARSHTTLASVDDVSRGMIRMAAQRDGASTPCASIEVASSPNALSSIVRLREFPQHAKAVERLDEAISYAESNFEHESRAIRCSDTRTLGRAYCRRPVCVARSHPSQGAWREDPLGRKVHAISSGTPHQPPIRRASSTRLDHDRCRAVGGPGSAPADRPRSVPSPCPHGAWP